MTRRPRQKTKTDRIFVAQASRRFGVWAPPSTCALSPSNRQVVGNILGVCSLSLQALPGAKVHVPCLCRFQLNTVERPVAYKQADKQPTSLLFNLGGQGILLDFNKAHTSDMDVSLVRPQVRTCTESNTLSRLPHARGSPCAACSPVAEGCRVQDSNARGLGSRETHCPTYKA
jgi:hypothetical protein